MRQYLIGTTLFVFLSSLAGTAGASVISVRPAQTGAYATVDGMSVPISEGSRLGKGIRLGNQCLTVAPIHVQHVFDAENTAATVVWEFTEDCEAVVTEISGSSSGPAFDGQQAEL